MPSITNYQGNANQNDNALEPHTIRVTAITMLQQIQ